MTYAFFIPQIGPMEMMVILGVGILLFGKRLPEVGRHLGQGIIEFKNSFTKITDELDETSKLANKKLRD